MSKTEADQRHFLQWQIWEVVWKHEDGGSKQRPALVVSSSAYNATHDEIWVIKISTKLHDVPHRLEILKSDAAFAKTGLSETSYFYLANARKMRKSEFVRQYGTLGSFSALLTAIALKKAIPKGLP